MHSRRNFMIFAGVVGGVLILALLAHQSVAQHEALDSRNVIFESNYHLSDTHDDDLVVMSTTLLSLDNTSKVSGDASLVGDQIQVAGQVSGDLTALGKTITLDPSAAIQGDVRLMGTSVTVAGNVDGDLVVNSTGSVTIAKDTRV